MHQLSDNKVFYEKLTLKITTNPSKTRTNDVWGAQRIQIPFVSSVSWFIFYWSFISVWTWFSQLIKVLFSSDWPLSWLVSIVHRSMSAQWYFQRIDHALGLNQSWARFQTRFRIKCVLHNSTKVKRRYYINSTKRYQVFLVSLKTFSRCLNHSVLLKFSIYISQFLHSCIDFVDSYRK